MASGKIPAPTLPRIFVSSSVSAADAASKVPDQMYNVDAYSIQYLKNAMAPYFDSTTFPSPGQAQLFNEVYNGLYGMTGIKSTLMSGGYYSMTVWVTIYASGMWQIANWGGEISITYIG